MLKMFAVGLASATVVTVLADLTRPKGARMFNKGKNGESGLAFDSATSKTSKPGDPTTAVPAA